MKKNNNRITEIKRRAKLSDYVTKHYGPMTQRGNELWISCPLHGPERTPSFAIKEKGKGEQVFFCQGCGVGGDIIKFIELVDRCDVKTAIDRAAEFAGMGEREIREAQGEVPPPLDPDWHEQYPLVEATFKDVGALSTGGKDNKKSSFPFSNWKPKADALRNNPVALKWLLEKRGLTAETCIDLHLGFQQSCKQDLPEEFESARHGGWICFPRVMDGKVVAVKLRSMQCKAFVQVAHMDPKALFNIETVNAMEPVFITEGEFDTAIMEQAGFRAASIPSASNHKIPPGLKNKLKKAACIYLAGDNDGNVGNTAMQQLAVELGKGAFILTWPGAKDANEFFLSVCGGDVENFQKEIARLVPIARATPVTGFTAVYDQLMNEKEGTDARNDPHRLHFPWRAVDEMNYSPAGSVVVIYSTYSGTGKSVFTTQVATHEAKRGEVVVAYSPELAGKQYLSLLAAQLVGGEREAGLNRGGKVEYADFVRTAQLVRPTYAAEATAGAEFPDFFHPKEGSDVVEFYVGYKLPVSGTDEIIKFIEYTVQATGATRFVIDTLHRIITAAEGESQAQAEGRVAKELERIGHDYGCTFIVIGQSNKEAENLKEARRDEYGVLRGSREIQDVAYGVYLLHRKRLEREDATDLLSPEAELLLRKDRGRGPGPAKVPMLYRKNCSKFVVRDTSGQEPPPESSGPLPPDEDPR
jgi:KaiC/GvpD/RAD55 family RecA-like ATPase